MLTLNTEKMLAEKQDGIGWMTFNNPARRNATSLEMWQAIAVILKDFGADPAVRVVVMRGAGDKAFVSGADISQFEDERADAEAARRYNAVAEGARAAMAALEKPFIAMIRGYCLGGGVAIAMAADLRIASDDARFGIPAARLGIAYGMDYLKKLVDLVGPAYAKEILLTARRLSAQEALRIGLVNRVVPVAELEPVVRETCATIIDNAPLSLIANKAIIDEIAKDPAARDSARMEALARRCYDSADYAEGRRAFMEKRKPVWTGR
jgi:enoyl-CoA hydratase/carnithine racemase